MALCVVACHIYSHGAFQFDNKNLHFLFYSIMGYVPVSVFFFLSGYGLAFCYSQKGSNYVKEFPRHRLLPFYLIDVILIIIYSIIKVAVGYEISLSNIIQSFTFGGTVIEFGWYIQTILVLYILFWLVYSFKFSDVVKLIAVIGANILFCAVCFAAKCNTTLFATSICFSIGMLWERYKNRIDKALSNRLLYIVSIICAFSFAGASYFLSHILSGRIAETLQVSGTALAFTVIILLILKIIPIYCKVTEAIGKVSLEIYVMQGVIFIIMSYFPFANYCLYAGTVLAGTLILACLFHQIVKKIFNINKKAVR